MKLKNSAFIAITILVCISPVSLYPRKETINSLCPHLYKKTFEGYIPKGNVSAGVYEEVISASKLKQCVLLCCEKASCNVAFMNGLKCYHISCRRNEVCLPVQNKKLNSANQLAMVLVKPVEGDSWQEILKFQDNSKDEYNREFLNMVNSSPREDDSYKKYLLDELYQYENMPCSADDPDSCAPNEECVVYNYDSNSGICECKEGFVKASNGECEPIDFKDTPLRSSLPDLITEKIWSRIGSNENKTLPVTRQHLNVIAESKEVRLPQNEVTLLASVSTDANEDTKYQFEWTILKQPEGSAAVKHQNGGQLHLEKLIEGVYAFKVSASNTFAFGETFVNVTVLPAKRINQPPKIIITPANQTIKQPNAAAVLDASSSTDDDGIVSWHWELQQGPLGYQPQLKDSSTLQLNDLTKPGNYTFKLTVTDTDKATSSSTANITVLKFTDYPPEANAGEDKIIFLPQNAITLYGNMSSDDHAITTWEWTKSADDGQKAVDMQDTRTPFLQLSNLEEGVYTFNLKVTDSANQSSTAQVHVFVKPPTNKPPVANAGHNLTISLPQTWVQLDGSNSTDDNKIIDFKWEQIEGPSTAVFDHFNASKTNVTGLTKGTYTFKLTVTDNNNNKASDNAFVIVNQNKNEKPKANAGEHFIVELPRNVVYLNGSNSKDDWAIVKWKWVRNEKSISIGNIAEKSDESPILIITDLVIGKYAFNLTVWDEQGLSDTDIVEFVVKEDPKLLYLVEITVDVEAKALREEQYTTLKGKLALLVNEGDKLKVRGIKPDPVSGEALMTFYVETADGKPVAANDVVKHLRQKLNLDLSLLGFEVSRLRTAVCQNNCSGHGFCNEQTRKCECETFWMQDLFKSYFKLEEDSDCSWSVLYVVLGVISGILLFTGSIIGTFYLCCSWCSRRKSSRPKPATYKLIDDTEDLPPFAKKGNLSDSDTDSDVVFESRSKPNRFSDRNGHKPSRNGFSKFGRRVKT